MERAHAHDASIAEHLRLQRVHDIAEMNKRHVAAAVDLQSTVVKRLQLLVQHPTGIELTPLEMVKIFDKAAIIERRAHDTATAIDLSKLSDAELQLFQQLVSDIDPVGSQ